MKLVPQNINEVIKHLSPRSEQEINDMFEDICNEIADDFENYDFDDYYTAYEWAQNHKERILELMEREYSVEDIVRIILYGPEYMYEAIKHLSARSSTEIRKYIATIIKPFYQNIKEAFKNYDFKGYDITLDDDDTCIHIEKNGEIKFRIYYAQEWGDRNMFSMYIYKNGKYVSSFTNSSAWGFASYIMHKKLNEGIKHLSGYSQEYIENKFKAFSIVDFYDFYYSVHRESLRDVIKYFPILFQIAWKIDKHSSIHYNINEKHAYVRIFKGNTTIIDLEQNEGDSFAIMRTGRGEYKINSIKEFNDKTGSHLIE